MRDVSETEVETVWAKKQRRKHASRFLKGPIPLTALQHAARLPGKALALYLAIRHRTDLACFPTVSLPAVYLNAWHHRALPATWNGTCVVRDGARSRVGRRDRADRRFRLDGTNLAFSGNDRTAIFRYSFNASA